jgi:hypothetical protein
LAFSIQNSNLGFGQPVGVAVTVTCVPARTGGVGATEVVSPGHGAKTAEPNVYVRVV